MPSQYMANGVVRTITAATATLTDYEAGGLVVVNRAAGCVITLPAATGTGYKYTITTIVDQTGDLKVQVVGTDVMQGVAMTDMTGVLFATAATSDTITLNGTTKGGLAGARIELMDVASGKWNVLAISEASGTEVTPFSAAVS